MQPVLTNSRHLESNLAKVSEQHERLMSDLCDQKQVPRECRVSSSVLFAYVAMHACQPPVDTCLRSLLQRVNGDGEPMDDSPSPTLSHFSNPDSEDAEVDFHICPHTFQLLATGCAKDGLVWT